MFFSFLSIMACTRSAAASRKEHSLAASQQKVQAPSVLNASETNITQSNLMMKMLEMIMKDREKDKGTEKNTPKLWLLFSKGNRFLYLLISQRCVCPNYPLSVFLLSRVIRKNGQPFWAYSMTWCNELSQTDEVPPSQNMFEW